MYRTSSLILPRIGTQNFGHSLGLAETGLLVTAPIGLNGETTIRNTMAENTRSFLPFRRDAPWSFFYMLPTRRASHGRVSRFDSPCGDSVRSLD